MRRATALPLPLRAALGLGRLAPVLPRALALRAHRRMSADPERFAERLGRASVRRPDGQVIWVHAASVGEVAAVRDLARDLAAERGAQILFTTTTQGGAGAVPDGAIHQFAPLDTPRAVRGFLNHWRPDLGIFVESDLWPRLVLGAAARRVPLALVNARASRTRRRLPRSMEALLARFAVITTQDQTISAELRALGIPQAESVGDLRTAAAPLPVDPAKLAAMRETIGDRPVWAAVSTHPGDEEAVVRAAFAARAAHPGLLLLWAPRHPARAEAIQKAARDDGLSVARRGLGEALGPKADILLLDTLGETGIVFRLAPLTFLGGSFGPENGHNPWEPIALGCAVLSGPNVANHREGFARLEAAGAARVLQEAAALGPTVAGLLGSPELAAMQRAARLLAAQGSSARERTLALLRPLLAVAPRPE